MRIVDGMYALCQIHDLLATLRESSAAAIPTVMHQISGEAEERKSTCWRRRDVDSRRFTAAPIHDAKVVSRDESQPTLILSVSLAGTPIESCPGSPGSRRKKEGRYVSADLRNEVAKRGLGERRYLSVISYLLCAEETSHSQHNAQRVRCCGAYRALDYIGIRL